MNEQLKISFPRFSAGIFNEIRQAHAESEQEKLLKEVEHLKHQVAAFKGWKTKRSKK